MTALNYWDYLPNFDAPSTVTGDLRRIERLEKEIAETTRNNRRGIAEARAAIETRIAAEYTPDEIRVAKIKAGTGEFCACGERIVTSTKDCPQCGREWFPF